MTRMHRAPVLAALAFAVAALAAGFGGDGADNEAQAAASPKAADQVLRLVRVDALGGIAKHIARWLAGGGNEPMGGST
jgi:hypothetical protein